MGQILSWIRGPSKDTPDLLDVAVEQQSQPSQTTPTPAVTTVKPSQFEQASSASGMASKPTAVATAMGGAGDSTGRGASVVTAGKGPAKAMPETAHAGTNRGAAGSASLGMSSSGTTIVDMKAAAKGSANVAAKTPPVSQVKEAAAAAAAAVPSLPTVSTRAAATAAPAAQAKPTPKDTTKSAPATAPPPHRDTPKADPAKAAKPAGVAVAPATAAGAAAAAAAAAGGVSGKGKTEVGKPAQTKVQVEVAPPKPKAAKEAPAVDPFDALASSLPTVGPVKPEPVYTGPEVHEHGVTAEIGVRCGDRDDTLPPGYRYENMPTGPVVDVPKDVPKPMSTNEALDALSFGFSSAPTVAVTPVQQPEKMDSVDAIDALSAGFSNFAPPPPASVKSPAPPVDKKAKKDDVADGFSLMGAVSSPAPLQKPAGPKLQQVTSAAPVATVKATKPTKPKVEDLDPFAALGDTLAAPEPVPESPPLRPEDIVSEAKLTEEEGVLVGERDDTIPEEYRFNEDKKKNLPAPKPEPCLPPGEALDFLSEGFLSAPVAAPVVQAPVLCPSAPPAQQAEVEDMFALDALAGEFMTPKTASAVQAPLPSMSIPKNDACDSGKLNTAVQAPSGTAAQDDLCLDALSALSDSLAAPEPAPEAPPLRPEDIVSEGPVTTEVGVRVGERDDTLPPEYRFSGDKPKDLPAPKPEPGLNTSDALDILSGDFLSPSVTPVVQAPVCSPPQPPKAACASDDALDALAGDFVATAVVAPAVKCAASQPTQTSLQMSVGSSSAMDALSDTLMDIQPVPEPAPLPMKDIAKEKKIEEERLILMGEDDDTLPPEYRPTEEDIKKAAEEAKKPKEKPMGDHAALELLSSDFATAPTPVVAPSPAAPVVAPCVAPPPQLQPPPLDSEPLKPMAGAALDSLAGSLLPDVMKTSSTGAKPKQQTTVPTPDSSSATPQPEALDAKSKGDKAKGKSKSRSKSKKQHADDPSAIDVLAGDLSSNVVSTKKGGKS